MTSKRARFLAVPSPWPRARRAAGQGTCRRPHRSPWPPGRHGLAGRRATLNAWTARGEPAPASQPSPWFRPRETPGPDDRPVLPLDVGRGLHAHRREAGCGRQLDRRARPRVHLQGREWPHRGEAVPDAAGARCRDGPGLLGLRATQTPFEIPVTDLTLFDRSAYGSGSSAGVSVSALFAVKGQSASTSSAASRSVLEAPVTAAQLVGDRLP